MDRTILVNSGRHPRSQQVSSIWTSVLVVAGLLNGALWTSIWRITEAQRDIIAALTLSSMVLIWLALVGTAGRLKGSPPIYSRIGIRLLFFLAFYIFTTLLTSLLGSRGDNSAMWLQLLVAILPACLFFGYYRVAQVGPIDRGMVLATCAVLAICMISIGLEFAGILSIESYGSRYFGFLSDNVAWLLSFSAILLLALRWYTFLAACLLTLALTQSRGAIITLAAGAALLFLTSRGRASRGQLATLLVLCVGGWLGYMLFEEEILGAVNRLTGTNFADNDRVWTIRLALTLFEQSPIYGMGYNSQPSLYTREFLATNALLGWSTPTSTAFQVLSDGGLITIAAYLAFGLALTALSISVLRDTRVDRETLVCRGLAAWLIAFLWTNQTAAWLIPGSYLAPLVFASAGVLAGRAYRLSMLRAGRPENNTPRGNPQMTHYKVLQ